MNLHCASRVSRVRLNLRSIEAGRFVLTNSVLSQPVLPDAARNDSAITEQSRHVCKIRGSAAKLFAVAENVPQKFAEADDRERRAHGLASSRDCNCSASF